jgi:hypothetical protein
LFPDIRGNTLFPSEILSENLRNLWTVFSPPPEVLYAPFRGGRKPPDFFSNKVVAFLVEVLYY